MDGEFHAALRPISLAGFVGQSAIRDNLRTFLDSARTRQAALDHVLLYGPPGLGKTTLAQIIAAELGSRLTITMAPGLKKTQDLVTVLGKIEPRDVLFLDEIHRLPVQAAEIMYPIMEDFRADFQFGEGKNKRSVSAHIAPFTVIGATTRAGALPQPLRDRFGIHLKLDFYSVDELRQVLENAAHGKLSIPLPSTQAMEIAKRARGTPRIALTLLRRIYDFAVTENWSAWDNHVDDALLRLGIDGDGLNSDDHRYLRSIAEQFSGGPAGVEAIAAAMGEERDTVEDVIEPYLIQAGFVQRTARGRTLTPISLARYYPGLKFEGV